MSTSYQITGRDALRLAARDKLTVYCDGFPVTTEFARDVANKETPSLVYVHVRHEGWWEVNGVRTTLLKWPVGCWFSEAGVYIGPSFNGVEPVWVDATPEAEVGVVQAEAPAWHAKAEWFLAGIAVGAAVVYAGICYLI